MNDHIALLVKATEDMSEAEQITFHQAFEGAILFFIPRDRWVQAINIASEVVKKTAKPVGPSPEKITQVLKKHAPFKRIIRK